MRSEPSNNSISKATQYQSQSSNHHYTSSNSMRLSHPSPARTASGGIETSEGTLYITKPFRSRTSKKMKAMIAFTPRKSHFDIENESSKSNEFRGFFTLFWISMFIVSVRTYVRSIETTGYPLELAFASSFSRDAVTLAITDAILVLSTAICVPFVKAISKGWIRYYWTGIVIQHAWQALVLSLAVTWTFNRQWPWVQSGFLTLHCLVMLMKMHSYMSTNGYLQSVNAQAQSTLKELRQRTSTVGGWDEAVATARAHRKKLDSAQNSDSTGSEETSRTATPEGTPGVPDRATASYIDANAATALRYRLNVASSSANGYPPSYTTTTATPITSENVETTGTRMLPPGSVAKPGLHPLVDHPDEQIAALARDYSDMEAELTGIGPRYVRWPQNITLRDFAMYQLTPTLVYELEYPRTDRIRPLYVFEKTVATFGTFALLYTVAESFIIPLTPSADQSFFRSMLDLALPFMIAYLLLFYIIFECICNAFAELSYFADRQFYEDWPCSFSKPVISEIAWVRWNSTSWEDFSRKWNKPVHTFLLRHVYASTMSSYKLSRQSAMFVTFLLSAAVHELVMAIVTKKIRMYLFVMQLIQVPLIALGRIPIIKRNRLFGNLIFWVGLYAGFPLLCVAYVAH